MSIKKRLCEVIELALLVWCLGGGFAASLLVLAVFNWRAALATFAMWIISLIAAVIWVATGK